MVIITFPDSESKSKAVGFLLGRFSGKVLKSGEVIVPEAALAALAEKDISFTVHGKASDDKAAVAPQKHQPSRELADIALPDPLIGFMWSTLHDLYDRECAKNSRFDPSTPALNCFRSRPATDRELYYLLVDQSRQDRERFGHLSVSTYEAIVFWKMYSTSPKTNNDIRRSPDIKETLSQRLKQLEFKTGLKENATPIKEFVAETLRLGLYGMKLPVCTTVLHFMYPETIPIFDQMILRAMGFSRDEVQQKNLTQNVELYGRYFKHHWELVRRYGAQFSGFRESPVRLVEMALWVNRGG